MSQTLATVLASSFFLYFMTKYLTVADDIRVFTYYRFIKLHLRKEMQQLPYVQGMCTTKWV